jgi:DNA-binding transcriptional MerR regulator
MFDFLKKKDEVVAPAAPDLLMPASSPVDEVIRGKQQGLTNDQIIAKLKSEGFSFSQIQDAFSQAEIKSSVISPGTPVAAMPRPEPVSSPFSPSPSIEAPMATTKIDTGIDEIERLLEEIIKEKWKDVTSKLGMLDNWKIEIDTKISNVDKNLSVITRRLDDIQNSILSKNEEYGKTIVDTQTEIQALEKVMGKLVPSMTENIKELREIIEDTKTSPKPKPK